MSLASSVRPVSELALRARLEVAAGRVGVPLSVAQAEQLLTYVDLLGRWNRTYNLVSTADPSAVLGLHVVDCLAVVAPMRRTVGGRDRLRIADVGSGAGLPGIVLAVMEPAAAVVCIDSVGKKASFVRHAASVLGLANLRAEQARVERLSTRDFDVVTCRAFASLSDMVQATESLLTPDGVWMAMKGKRPDAEIAALPADAQVFHVEPLVVPDLEAARCLVWLRRAPST